MRLLEVSDLRVLFPVGNGLFKGPSAWLKAVDGVSLGIARGTTLGVVGESGCGKSTLAKAIVRLIEPTSGRIWFNGRDITRLNDTALREFRRELQMVFQDPYNSLNPRFTVEQIVGEAVDIHGLCAKRDARRERVARVLGAVGLDPAQMQRYPHEFSGGQRQRIGIARALAVEPALMICDEPVSALDVSVQAQIVNLLVDLQRERELAYLFISHDLAVVEHISHRVMVMYLGKVMETADAKVILRMPKHPYTQALIAAIPTIEPGSQRRRLLLPGDVPSPITAPAGCVFHPRCPCVETRCRIEAPALRELTPGHSAACHLAAAGTETSGTQS